VRSMSSPTKSKSIASAWRHKIKSMVFSLIVLAARRSAP
jgi:hypothetical protein